jgi:hypothetical protein
VTCPTAPVVPTDTYVTIYRTGTHSSGKEGRGINFTSILPGSHTALTCLLLRRQLSATMFGGNTNEPLISNHSPQQENDDAASQSSQRSTGGRSVSLLERIQQQRQRELEAAASTAAAASLDASRNQPILSGGSQMPPQNIQVPQYEPSSAMPGFGSNDFLPQQSMPHPTTGIPQENNYLSNAWNSFAQNMESSMVASSSNSNNILVDESQFYTNTQDDMRGALLPPTGAGGMDTRYDDSYSISDYFFTFVKDVYGLFLRLHVVLRVVVVVGLLYAAMKLLFYT